MTASERRNFILQALETTNAPLSASKLALTLGVSRQLVVGDVALLRASGIPVFATPRGYLLESAGEKDGLRCVVACRHDRAHLKDELYTVVDCGCGVLDVIVEHPVYGQLSGQLQIFSRYDADNFCKKLLENEAQPLCHLTGDVHLHTLRCPSEAHREQVMAALTQKGFIFDV